MKKLFTAAVLAWLLLLGTWLGGFGPALLFTCAFLFLRKRTGGYRAYTRPGCAAMASAAELLAMWMLPRLVFEVCTVMLAGSFICVLLLAPAGRRRPRLAEKELQTLRRRVRLRAFALLALSLLLWNRGYFDLAAGAALAIFFTAASLVLATLGFGMQ